MIPTGERKASAVFSEVSGSPTEIVSAIKNNYERFGVNLFSQLSE
ncbi:Uncharacterized protein dnm_079200 [Desulfonema magnum]|uniref:Uncharacterized protein n=1 Tax=Desulfonema magnum TaxID=45655 RepID=A0A975BU77_9BACT|nr:Uncharacterized protein dnm_079200 [Desulfonema magnum]